MGITAGNQIDAGDCLPDHSGTYGAKLCEHFAANCTTLAISGKGIYQNCCDDDVTMSELYRRSIVGDPMSIYNDQEFVPDAVLLNLGTNDQGHAHGSAEWIEGFTQTYAEFLLNLTKVHRNLRTVSSSKTTILYLSAWSLSIHLLFFDMIVLTKSFLCNKLSYPNVSVMKPNFAFFFSSPISEYSIASMTPM